MGLFIFGTFNCKMSAVPEMCRRCESECLAQGESLRLQGDVSISVLLLRM